MEENKPELGGGVEAKLAVTKSEEEAKVKRTTNNLIKMSVGKDGFRKTKNLTRKQIENHYRVIQVNFNNLSVQTNKQNSVLTAYIKLSSMALGELYMVEPDNHMFAEEGGVSPGMLEDAKNYKRQEPKKEEEKVDIKKEEKPDVPVQDKAV